ncbi:hypothetical protein GA0115240_16689 [Streptomyces sp. DvalAA-14]|uniref:hypothetical protein n=1 Tax=unclassified Streptomyces TaxID=2593676 RepID=UPI00081BAD90|nr:MULTISPECIES: hypothetical protein [unclassified Streptomyces]MYS24645.1 hypothetical protein [Streptomyces sp. SID4948]SCE48036.1 hypothetical protein GA0115240_16689 [Streptomyces sp. DvalAA-14]
MIRRRLGSGAAALALAVPLAGCMTVHGERADIPSVRPAEAAQVLAHFAAVSNAATKAYDPALVTRIEAGPLGAIDEAGLRAEHAVSPAGNPAYAPLVFSDPRFLIPRQVGWPKFFVADTAVNRGTGVRWLLVFRRAAAGRPWKADYLAVAAAGAVPAPATDGHGGAVAVPPAGTDLLVQPARVAASYTTYLQQGAGAVFAAGSSTTQLRATRDEHARTPDSVTQYADQPAQGGDFDPVALRTKDGGALVFFGTRHQSRATYRAGYRLAIDADTKALMTGTPHTSVTLSSVGQQLVAVPRGGGTGQVTFLSRIVGLVSAQGG